MVVLKGLRWVAAMKRAMVFAEHDVNLARPLKVGHFNICIANLFPLLINTGPPPISKQIRPHLFYWGFRNCFFAFPTM